MIPKRELLELRTEWALDVNIIEKDYLLGWLLAGIANDQAAVHKGARHRIPAADGNGLRAIADDVSAF